MHVMNTNPDVNLGDSCVPYNTYEEILGDHQENFTMKFIPQLISIITHENLQTWQRAGNKIHGVRKSKSKGGF